MSGLMHGALAAALVASADAALVLRSGARGDPKPAASIEETLNTMMCLGKVDEMHHKTCVNFMIDTCAERSSGQDTCKQLKLYIKTECKAGTDKSASACSYGEQLVESPGSSAEKPAESSEKKTAAEKLAPASVKMAAKSFDDKTRKKASVQASPPSIPIPDRKPVEVDDQWWKKDDQKEEPVAKDGTVPGGLGGAAEAAAGAPSSAPAGAPSPGPAPGPASAPGPAAPSDVGPDGRLWAHSVVSLDKNVPDEGLPDQGFSEHSTELVDHEDSQTMTADWGKEWPQRKETEAVSKERACKKYPHSEWCRMYMAARHHFGHPYIEPPAALGSSYSQPTSAMMMHQVPVSPEVPAWRSAAAYIAPGGVLAAFGLLGLVG